MMALDELWTRIQRARRVSPYVQYTDIVPVHMPDGRQLHVKCENLQVTGSFKVRGAFNFALGLDEQQRKRGLLAASAGNHAQGVALAARALGIRCTIVMPRTAPLSKIEATRRYGAEVILEGAGYDDAYAHAKKIEGELGALFVHAFDNMDIIAGQGTVGLEILEQMPDVQRVLVPVGGGGLISGIAAAIKHERPQVRIIGVEAATAASMAASLAAKSVRQIDSAVTIADGIAVKRPSELTFACCERWLDGCLGIPDEDIASTILFLMEKAKIVSEGAGAVAVAAVLTQHPEWADENTVAVLSGGNIDMTVIARIIDKGLIREHRKAVMRVMLPDRPGYLARILAVVAQSGANVVSISHNRLMPDISVGSTIVDLELETRDLAHIRQIEGELLVHGFELQNPRGGR